MLSTVVAFRCFKIYCYKNAHFVCSSTIIINQKIIVFFLNKGRFQQKINEFKHCISAITYNLKYK